MFFFGPGFHVVERIFLVSGYVVGIDGQNGKTRSGIFFVQGQHAVFVGFGKRAMIASKNHNQPFLTLEITQRNVVAIDVF